MVPKRVPEVSHGSGALVIPIALLLTRDFLP